MSADYFHRRNWDEYQWEKEIRRDERRISSYLRELSGCLDLPGEEEMIFNRLAADRDIIPVGATADSIRSWCYSGLDENRDSEEAADARPGKDMVDFLDFLAAEWNFFISGIFEAGFSGAALGVSCSYAKLLARAIDFVESDPVSELQLKLSLGKRMLADLNELIAMLKKFRKTTEKEAVAEYTAEHIVHLLRLRTGAADMMTYLRSNPVD